jgi:hypothetical protein
MPRAVQDAFISMTWVNLTANSNGKVAGFVDWGWAVGSCIKSSCDGLNLPDEAIFATMYEHAGDWDTAWDPDVHFVRSDDWFKTIKQKVGAWGICIHIGLKGADTTGRGIGVERT